MRIRALMVLVLCACGDGDDDDEQALPLPDASGALAPPPAGKGFQVTFETVAPAGEEIWSCHIYDGLPGDQETLNVQWAESRVTAGVHHADFMTTVLTGLSFEPGTYDCNELYTMNRELMERGLFIYGTQSEEEKVVLPEGYVAPLPRDAQYMMEIHYVNTTDEDVDVSIALNAWLIEGEPVGTIWGDANRDFNLVIPPGVPHEEWTRCEFDKDVDVIFLQSHTHELAQKFEIRTWDGNAVGDLIYENDDWKSPHLQEFDPPLHVPMGQGFEYRCKYNSDRTTTTNWGFSAQDEMCQFGYVFIPGDSMAKCVTVETSDGVILDNPPD